MSVEARPLGELGLGWRDHRSALWWLGMLYRRPGVVVDSLASLPRGKQVGAGLWLWLHVLPYVVLVAGVGRASLLRLSETPWTWASFGGNVAIGVGVGAGIGFAVVTGILLGFDVGASRIAFGNAGGIAIGIAAAICYGISGGIPVAIASGIIQGIVVGTGMGIAVGISGGIAWRIVWVGIVPATAGGIALGLSSGIAVGIAFGIAAGIAMDIGLFRLYYLFVYPVFTWPSVRGRLYSWHPVAWDDLCAAPFPGLDRLLVAYTELDIAAGEREIERLVTSYPSQRVSALRARITLLARRAGRVGELRELSGVAAKLPEGDKVFLVQAKQVREWLEGIARLQLKLDTVDRPMLREPYAQNLVQEIENFRHRLAGFEEPLRTEFRSAAEKWESRARADLEKAQRALGRQPVRQVFRAGDPVDRESEAFVLRDVLMGQLDQQVTLEAGCPGVVLYARRRMGKSTLLYNLRWFLPDEVRVEVISLQDPEAFTSLEYLVSRIAAALPELDKSEAPRDLPGLQRCLSTTNARLKEENRRVLLAIDEYEQMDLKIGEGVFPLDLLAAIRESIQTHRRITWLFAGSHEITELVHAQWTSYLVSARTIEIQPFSLEETRLLLTEPLKHSPLWDSKTRPRFAAELWGAGGIERIHNEADGWPHLLQLIAETLVDFLNTEGVREVTPALMERALDQAVMSGHIVLSQLMQGESALPGEWEYVSAFRTREEQAPPEDEGVRRSLRRRQIVREENGQWRLRVPLMARWLRLRG